MGKKRIVWLDISKGIAILLMVFGHSSIPDMMTRFIWSFHMPLFFISSGWLTNYEKKSIAGFVVQKNKSLLLPFFIYSIIVLLLYGFIFGTKVSDVLMNGWGGYALWFIPILYFSLLLSYLYYKIDNNYFRWTLAFAFLSLAFVLSYLDIRLPWSLSTIPYASLLIIIGHEIKRVNNFIENRGLFLLMPMLLITISISFFWKLDMCDNSILPIAPLTIGAVSGTLFVFICSQIIDRKIVIVSRFLSAVGRETFLILAFSQIIIMIINHYFSFHFIVKYVILFGAMFMLKMFKDVMKSMVKTKVS